MSRFIDSGYAPGETEKRCEEMFPGAGGDCLASAVAGNLRDLGPGEPRQNELILS